MTNKLVTVHPDDNVLICCQPLIRAESVAIEGNCYEILDNIEVGHKIAKVNLNKGDKVIRYGVPIGSATSDISIGEHIHIHNMKSDYIPSHTRQAKVGE